MGTFDLHTHCTGIVIYRINPELELYEVVLIQTEKFKDKDEPLYTIPGGKKKDSDVSIEACARREAKEETNLDLEELTQLGEPTYVEWRTIGRDKEGGFYSHRYMAQAKGQLRTGSDATYAAWHAVALIHNLSMAPDIRNLIQYAIKQTESETSRKEPTSASMGYG
jgi:ADP-ribose pyrophosphatase YjhB (NUDIX family)